MAASLFITLREGLEAALIIGIVLAYLRRTGRSSLNRYVYWGLGLAILVSIVVGVFLQIIGIDPENELLEGSLFALGGIFVGSMVLWMWRNARNVRRQMEARMADIVAKEKTSRGVAVGLLAFTFFMVAREGVETVLFLAAATLGEAGILDLIGGTLGIALAVLFAVLFIRGSMRINLGRFFSVTTVVLLVLALRLLVGSVHEFAEVGVIPMSRSIMQVLGYFLRGRASTLLLTGIVLAPILLVLWDLRRAEAALASPGESGAERRKRLAARRWEKTWQLSLLGATGVIVLFMVYQAFAPSPFLDPSPMPIAGALGEELSLSTADWEPGRLYKFSYLIAGAEVRFLAAKLGDGSLATAVDACQICGIKGYMQEKDNQIVVCKVCNAPIPMSTMGLGGGCNPLALTSRTVGDTLVIPLKGLQSQAQLFKGQEARI